MSKHSIGLTLATALLLISMSASAAKPKPKGHRTTGAMFSTSYGDLEIFSADNPWNQDISKLKVHPLSAKYIASIGPRKPIHPGFGRNFKGVPNGTPYTVVGKNQKAIPVEFSRKEESDPGPYFIPFEAPIEGGPSASGDRHVIVVDFFRKKLYELYIAFPDVDAGLWKAEVGTVFDLASNTPRPPGASSADPAGLPIFPGLVRYFEVESGEITHALRFTVGKTQRGYISPATRWSSAETDPNLPPMGLRFRLKASFDDSKLPKSVRVICRALKKYGMFVAGHGRDWFVSGAPHPEWSDQALGFLKKVKGSDMEAVDTGPVVTTEQSS